MRRELMRRGIGLALAISVVGVALTNAAVSAQGSTEVVIPSDATVDDIQPGETIPPTVSDGAPTSVIINAPSAAPIGTESERTFRIDPARSRASYEAQEKFAWWDVPNKAVASTNHIEGELTLTGGESLSLAANHFAVDLRTLTSESGETPQGFFGGESPLRRLPTRDRIARENLEAATFPMAEFTAMQMTGLPSRYIEGQEATVQVQGNLSIRGQTRPVVFATTVTLRGDVLAGKATTRINMSDFGVRPPSIGLDADLPVSRLWLHVEDSMAIVVEFTAVAGRV